METCEGPFPTQEPPFRVPPGWPIAPLEETLLNQLVATANVTAGIRTGRKKGGRKKGRKNEEEVSQLATGIRTPAMVVILVYCIRIVLLV